MINKLKKFKIDKPINKEQYNLIAKAVREYGDIYFCGSCKNVSDSFVNEEGFGDILYFNDKDDSTHTSYNINAIKEEE